MAFKFPLTGKAVFIGVLVILVIIFVFNNSQVIQGQFYRIERGQAPGPFRQVWVPLYCQDSDSGSDSHIIYGTCTSRINNLKDKCVRNEILYEAYCTKPTRGGGQCIYERIYCDTGCMSGRCCGKRVYLEVNDSVTVLSHKTTLLNVGSSLPPAAIVSVDGFVETVIGTETVNDLRITVEDTFYSDSISERSAILVLGSSC